jgi:hypothetical protein
MRRFGSMALVWMWTSLADAAPPLEEVARDGDDGVLAIDNATAPVIADDGTVIFLTRGGVGTVAAVHYREPTGAPRKTSLTGQILRYPTSLVSDAAGNVAFVGSRLQGTEAFRGVYWIPRDGDVEFVYESPVGSEPGTQVASNVALAPNGTLAFSTFAGSRGALHRSRPFLAPDHWIVSLDFANSRSLDVNDAGDIAVDLEYVDPRVGLRHGVFVIDQANQRLTASDSAIDALRTEQPVTVSLNELGQVAYVLDRESPLPENWFVPGLYLAEPTRWGTPKDANLLRGQGSQYRSFGKLALDDDSGRVVFEAELSDGRRGIFTESQPLVVTGDVINGVTVASVALGDVNPSGQVSFVTLGGDGKRHVFRASCVFDGQHRVAGPVEIRSVADAEALRCVSGIDGDLRIEAEEAPWKVTLPSLSQVTGNVSLALALRPRVAGDALPGCGMTTSPSAQRSIELPALERIGGSLNIRAPNTLADASGSQVVDVGLTNLSTVGGDLDLDFSTSALVCGLGRLTGMGGNLRLHAVGDLLSVSLLGSVLGVSGEVAIRGPRTAVRLLENLQVVGSLVLEPAPGAGTLLVGAGSFRSLRVAVRDLSLTDVDWPSNYGPLAKLLRVGGTLRLKGVGGGFALDDVGSTLKVGGLELDATSLQCLSARSGTSCVPFSAASLLTVQPMGSIRMRENRGLRSAQVCGFVEDQRSRGFRGSVMLDVTCPLATP